MKAQEAANMNAVENAVKRDEALVANGWRYSRTLGKYVKPGETPVFLDQASQDQLNGGPSPSRMALQDRQAAGLPPDPRMGGGSEGARGSNFLAPWAFNEDDEDDEDARGPGGPKMPGLNDLPNYTLWGAFLKRFSER